jgi:Ca2+-binding RTX toxin-like protein
MDTADYSAAAAAITVTLAGTAPPTMTVAVGTGEPDLLESIEILIGSAHGDLLAVEALTAAAAAAIDHIDLGGGTDTLDLSALAGPVELDLTDIAGQTLEPASGGVLNLRNVERHILTSGDDVAIVGAGVVFVDGGGGDDRIEIATAGSRVDGGLGTVLLAGAGSFAFANVETIVGGAQGNLIYGGTLAAHYVGGAGVNYLEGSGAGTILESTSGDSWIVALDGATVVSGAGDDLIEAAGAAPVTIVFSAGSGHDMLGSHFGGKIVWPADPGGLPYLAPQGDSYPDRLGDTILLSGLTAADIELVWEWQAYQAPLYVLGGSDPYDFKVGPAAIRIVATGDTLHLGTLAAAWIDGDFCLVLIGDHEWDIALDFADGEGSAYAAFAVDADLFEFGTGLRYGLMDLFDLEAMVSTPLPAAWSAAEGLLARLGSEAGAIVNTDDGGFAYGTAGGDDFFGGLRDDYFVGGDGDDFARGSGGSDVFYGSAGDDDIGGGEASDAVDYGDSAAAVTVDLAAGTATGADIGSDRLSSIETVIGGSGDDSLAGTAGPDHLVGGEGDDLLEGRGGDDGYAYTFAWAEDGNLDGGDDVVADTGGFDTLYLPWGIGAADITVSLAPGDSYLLEFAGGGSVTLAGAALPAGTIEEVWLGDGGWWDSEMLAALAYPVVETVGTALADTLDGTDGRRNRLVGLGGDDVLTGRFSDDRLEGGDGDDALDGRDGSDLLEGGDGADTLAGGWGRDVLDGGAGADLIAGGYDPDVMTGGAGADIFLIGQYDTNSGAFADRIADFTPGEDLIDLSGFDGDFYTPGQQPLIFIGAAAFSGTAGEMRYETRGGDTWLMIDPLGHGWAWFEIALTGSVAPVAADFLL